MKIVKELAWELGGEKKESALSALNEVAQRMRHTPRMQYKWSDGDSKSAEVKYCLSLKSWKEI